MSAKRGPRKRGSTTADRLPSWTTRRAALGSAVLTWSSTDQAATTPLTFIASVYLELDFGPGQGDKGMGTAPSPGRRRRGSGGRGGCGARGRPGR